MGYRDIFEELEPDERVHMLQRAEECVVESGVVILEEGRPNRSIYVILDGEVAISREDVQLATLGLGSIFGEMAFLTGDAASATVTTIDKTTVLRIDHQQITDLIQEKSDFGTRFYRSIAGTLAVRLKRTSEKVRQN